VQLARSAEATQITEQGAPTGSEPIDVAWVGSRPTWLDSEVVVAALGGFSVASTVSENTRVVHLAREASETVAAVRAAHPRAAVVVDLGSAPSARAATLVDAADADIALVESMPDADEVRERERRLEGKVHVSPAPVDLEWYAPESTLTRLRDAHIRRFRRLHRLAHPSLLFVGPYTRSGGLDIAIAAAYRLREELADLRLAAIPLGAIDQKYLDQCEMDALALGHRGIIQWTCSDDDLRFWYATASVVCCPWREAAEAPQAAVLAAAAARPFISSDLAVFRHSLPAADVPQLIPPGSVDALVDSLTPFLTDRSLADQLGERARSAAEAVYSYEAAAGRLADVWNALASSALRNQAA
jgi:glycosyltransferase involved in cell wall biosynthesis